MGERAIKQNPADAHDARPAGSVILFNHSAERYTSCRFKGQTIGERELSNRIQLMLMMLAPQAP